ncbi:hypothetical protein Tco_0299806 [Tanacetum coccineum]
MDLSNYEVPCVLVTCRSRLGCQIELLGDETDIVPLYYHIVDNFQIQFGREEFCLVTGLRFGVEYLDDYDNDEDPIPFRRRVFPSSGKTFVLLGLEDRRRVPDWILRLANYRYGWDKYLWGSYVWPTLYSQLRDANVRWLPNLYATEASRDVDKKTYSIFGFTWAFKINTDDIDALSNWWISNRAYFDGRISNAGRIPRHLNHQNYYEVPAEIYRQIEEQKRAMDQMLEKEAEREKRMSNCGAPSSFPTQGNNSFFEGVQATPSYGHNMATPNWQTPMPSNLGTSN